MGSPVLHTVVKMCVSTPLNRLLCHCKNEEFHTMDDTPVPSIRLPTDRGIQALPCFLLLPLFTRRNML